MPPDWPTSVSGATCPRSASSSCSPRATSTSCRCAAAWRASACRRRRTRSSRPAGRSSPRSTPARRSRALLAESGAGVSVPPDDAAAFAAAHRRPRRRPGQRRRRWAPRAALGGGRGLTGRRRRGVRRADRSDSPAAERSLASLGAARLAIEGPPVALRPRGSIILVDQEGARLAQKGKGKRVRFQGGTLFPLVVASCWSSGWRWSSTPGRRGRSRTSAPQSGIDHWHGAYGFQMCSDAAERHADGQPRGDGRRRRRASSPRHRHDRRAQPRRRRDPLAPIGIAATGRNAQARRVLRQLRHRAHRQPRSEVPDSDGFTRRRQRAADPRTSRSRTKRARRSATARTPG